MQPTGSVSALVVGSVSRDSERGGAPTPGGVVHHAGLAFARLGARTRIGDLPRHDGAFRQLRADGALVLSADLGPALTLDLAGGVGGYDLLWADAGVVADGALEVRW